MQIRKATLNDLDKMLKIYTDARSFMAKHGNPRQWGAINWPPKEMLVDDIKKGDSYVCTDDEGCVIGTFYYIFGEDIEPTYRKITEGEWKDSSPYGVVHRIAADGKHSGVGTFCLNWAYTQCRHLRIDTHGDNYIMQNLLTKLGFTHCGTIYVEADNDPRLAYEKSEII